MPATVNQLLERARALAPAHQKLPLLTEFASIGLGPEVPKTVVLTCCDPRCVPERFLGIGMQPTDSVIVIRNAGGHVTPEINSIVVLDTLVTVGEIMVIHHTDCGTLYFTDEQIKEKLKKQVPANLSSQIDKLEFGAIIDLEQSVLDDLAALRASPFIRKEIGERATGYIFDITTGSLTQVSEKL